MPQVWVKFLLRHVAVLIIGMAIGILYGQLLVGLVVATFGLLGWHMLQLFRLERWLRTGESAYLPDGNGIWPRTFARIQFIAERSRLNRRNWRRLIKELQASAKAFPDGGIILNSNNEIINYNKAARQLLGLKKKRDRGQRIDNLIRHPVFVAYLESHGDRESIEIPGLIGADTWLSCRIIPYGPGQRLLLVRDITQSVMLERMRSDFVANASHELRTPLTVISGYLDALADDDETPDAWTGPIQDMRQQTERMNMLVNDLLEISRLESSLPSSTENSVDLPAMLRSLKKAVLALEERPQTIDLQLDSEAGLQGEEAEVLSIVSNLVYNAICYTPPEGRVSIRWYVDNKGGHLMVKDTGIGIAPEDIPRLTERFFRADSGRNCRRSGTGLGLSIVKHALKRHDGELEIKSRLGEGSAFICHFPLSRLSVDQCIQVTHEQRNGTI